MQEQWTERKLEVLKISRMNSQMKIGNLKLDIESQEAYIQELSVRIEEGERVLKKED